MNSLFYFFGTLVSSVMVIQARNPWHLKIYATVEGKQGNRETGKIGSPLLFHTFK